MPLDELLINTGVDGLIRLIHKKGRIEMDEAARVLKISPQTIEGWAHVLEDEGVIAIDYQLTKVYLTWISGTQEEIAEKVEELQIKRNAAQEEIETRIAVAEGKGAELASMESQYREIYKSMEPRMAKIAEKLSSLKKFEKDKDTVLERHKTRLSNAKEALNELDESLKASEDNIRKVGLKAVEASGGKGGVSKTDIEAMRDYQRKIRDRSNEIITKYDGVIKLVGEQRDSIALIGKSNEMLKAAKNDLTALTTIKQRLIAELALLPERQRQIESGVSELSKASAKFRDAEKQANDLRGKIENLKRDADALNERMVSVSQGIREQSAVLSTLSRQIDIAKDVRTKLDAMSATRQAMSTDLSSIQEKQRSVEDNINRLNRLFSDIDRNKEKVGDLKGTLAQLSDMETRAQSEREQVNERAAELMKIIDDQVAKFTVLENVKSRTAVSIQSYMKDLDKIKADYTRQKGEFERDRSNIANEITGYKREIDSEIAGVRQASSKLDEALAKKGEVDEVLARITKLKEEQSILVKQLKLLAKEVQVLELKEEPTGWGGNTGEEKVVVDKLTRIKEKIETAKENEAEFDKKRKELKDMIDKMWTE